MTVPAIVQQMSSAGLFLGGTGIGDDFVYTLQNPISQGGCIVFGIAYPHGVTPTISDNNGNTWGAAAVTQDGGTLTDGNQAGLSIFVLPNANAGLTQFKAHFGSNIFVIDYFIAEFCNVASSSPANGTAGAGNVTAPNLACGSFTPGNNDANGGNLIVCYFSLFATTSAGPTGWVPGGSFTLMHGDVAWTAQSVGRPHAAQYFVQAASASINPGITATGDTSSYNCVAVALKASATPTGTPKPAAGSGKIWIDNLFHETIFSGTPVAGTFKFPVTGNLRVLLVGQVTGLTVTDNEGGSGNWTKVTSGGSVGEMWYSVNKSPNPNLILTLGNASFSFRLYDISNADASPFDVSAIAAGDCSGVATVSNAPTITPGITNGVVVFVMPLGQGPVLSITSPAGAVQDFGFYTGETDTDTLENADGLGHLAFTSSPGTLHVNWTIHNAASNNFGAVAISFKAAPATQQPAASLPFGILGFASNEW